jgi:hypothetical protein
MYVLYVGSIGFYIVHFFVGIDNYALKSVVLPTSLVAISDSAFSNCLALLTAMIPT